MKFFKFIFQVYLLFSDAKTMAALVNYTCKSFIKLTSVGYLLRTTKNKSS